MAEVLKYDAIAVGDRLPEFTQPPITSKHLALWAAGSGDFNPIHYDQSIAEKQGHAACILPGVYKAEVANKAMLQMVGPKGHICLSRARYTGIDLVGNSLTFNGTVTDKYENENGKFIACDYELTNQDEKVTVKGSAVLAVD